MQNTQRMLERFEVQDLHSEQTLSDPERWSCLISLNTSESEPAGLFLVADSTCTAWNWLLQVCKYELKGFWTEIF